MGTHQKLFDLAWDILENITNQEDSLEGELGERVAAWSRQRPRYTKRPRNTATRREIRRDKKRYRFRKSKLKRYRMQNKRKLREYQKHYNKRPNLHKVKGRV